jgi:hypothetical protein
MRRLIDRCAGIDVGQALLVVCVRVVDEKGRLDQQVRSFGATTPDLLDLRDWLAGAAVTCAIPETAHPGRSVSLACSPAARPAPPTAGPHPATTSAKPSNTTSPSPPDNSGRVKDQAEKVFEKTSRRRLRRPRGAGPCRPPPGTGQRERR